MYWATVVYFKKTPYVESFFNVVKDVKENWNYYKDLYEIIGMFNFKMITVLVLHM